MADTTLIGPMEQYTGLITQALSGPMANYPNHDAEGNVIGCPVLSLFTDVVTDFPSIVCQLVPSPHSHSGIGNVSDVAPQTGVVPPDPGVDPVPVGTVTETVIDPGATLEIRIMARSEMERARLMDWCYRLLMFHEPVGVLYELGSWGLTVNGLSQAPVKPDIDPQAPRPQGMPPWPGQLFFSVKAEYSVSFDPLAATTDLSPTVDATPVA